MISSGNIDSSEYSYNQKGTNMSGTNLMLIRASIVLGMVAAVVTILYLTPVPDQNFKSCDRPCHDLDWPMICRVRMTVEMIQSNVICEDCTNNSTKCIKSSCSSSEVTPRGIITANRQIPGPSIHVCHNDILIINVVNKIPGHSLSIHWRGQPNNEAPFMDGVPMVTQCPISSFTTFQYKFRVSSPGTHFYHAHSDSDRSNGLFGAIIVRQNDKLEPYRKQYDADLKDHLILLSEWSPDFTNSWNHNTKKPKSILINGKGPSGSAVTVFSVSKGKRYRFRVAYVGGNTGCPMNLAIDNHLLKVISLDGNPIKAYEASSVKLAKGERLDFVLKTNQKLGAYFLRVSSDCDKEVIFGRAVVSYEGTTTGAELKNLEFMKSTRVFDTSLVESGVGEISLRDIRALEKIDPVLQKIDMDRKLFLGFDNIYDEDDLTAVGLPVHRSRTYRINNITFTYPPSPLLTQPGDVPLDLLCNEKNSANRCAAKGCECVHIEHIPLGSSTEIILFDQGGDEEEHIFHLHGYHFYIVGSRIFEKPSSKIDVMNLDKANNLVKRNLVNPVRKDTVRVPKNGVVVLRFLADNPGFWLLRDEQSRGWTRGMDILLQVGAVGDVVSTPSDFPTCGNFIGPDFFLL